MSKQTYTEQDLQDVLARFADIHVIRETKIENGEIVRTYSPYVNIGRDQYYQSKYGGSKLKEDVYNEVSELSERLFNLLTDFNNREYYEKRQPVLYENLQN